MLTAGHKELNSKLGMQKTEYRFCNVLQFIYISFYIIRTIRQMLCIVFKLNTFTKIKSENTIKNTISSTINISKQVPRNNSKSQTNTKEGKEQEVHYETGEDTTVTLVDSQH